MFQNVTYLFVCVFVESLDDTTDSADKAKKSLDKYLSPLDDLNKFQDDKSTTTTSTKCLCGRAFLSRFAGLLGTQLGIPALRILFIVDNRDTVNLDFNYFFANILKLFKKIFTAIHNSINFVCSEDKTFN